MNSFDSFRAIVMGTSAGGVEILGEILPSLPKDYSLPIIIVLHVPSGHPSKLPEFFDAKTALQVREAVEKEPILPGNIYFAPPGYHLLVERDQTFSLSTEEPVHFSRPAIDVLFESAANAFGRGLVGVLLLTGASRDGAAGLKKIVAMGGIALIQDPGTARYPAMPEAGSALVSALHAKILSPGEIVDFLLKLPFNQDLKSRQKSD